MNVRGCLWTIWNVSRFNAQMRKDTRCQPKLFFSSSLTRACGWESQTNHICVVVHTQREGANRHRIRRAQSAGFEDRTVHCEGRTTILRGSSPLTDVLKCSSQWWKSNTHETFDMNLKPSHTSPLNTVFFDTSQFSEELHNSLLKSKNATQKKFANFYAGVEIATNLNNRRKRKAFEATRKGSRARIRHCACCQSRLLQLSGSILYTTGDTGSKGTWICRWTSVDYGKAQLQAHPRTHPQITVHLVISNVLYTVLRRQIYARVLYWARKTQWMLQIT